MVWSFDRRLLLGVIGVLSAKEAAAIPLPEAVGLDVPSVDDIPGLDVEKAQVLSTHDLRQPLVIELQGAPESADSEWSGVDGAATPQIRGWVDGAVVAATIDGSESVKAVQIDMAGSDGESIEQSVPVLSDVLIIPDELARPQAPGGVADERILEAWDVTAEVEAVTSFQETDAVRSELLAPVTLELEPLPSLVEAASIATGEVEIAPGEDALSVSVAGLPQAFEPTPTSPEVEAVALSPKPISEEQPLDLQQTRSEAVAWETMGVVDAWEVSQGVGRWQHQLQLNDAGELETLGLGMDWQLSPGLEAGASQRFYTAGPLEGASLSTLEVNGAQAIAPNTTLTARYALSHAAGAETEAGLLQQQTLGLKHRWQVMPKMFVDFNYERVWGRGLGLAELEQQPLTPLGFSDERDDDFVASAPPAQGLGQNLHWPDSLMQVSNHRVANRAGNRVGLGLNYLPGPKWQLQGRLRNRSEGDRSRTQVTTALRGQLTPRWSSSLDGEQTYATDPNVDGMGPTTHVRLGLAYRSTAPVTAATVSSDAASSGWLMRLRYEYRRNLDLSSDEDIAVSDAGFGSATHLAAAELSYQPAQRWQLRSQLALRHRALHQVDEPGDDGMAALAQLQGSYRLSPRFKLRGDVRSRYQLSGQGSQTGVALEAAYGVTRYLNLVVGYGLGKGRDRDFLKRGFTDGPYVRLKFR